MGGIGGGERGKGGAESGSGGGTGLEGRGGRGGGVDEGIGMGSTGSGGIGGKSGTDSAARSDVPEQVLFSDIDTAAVLSTVSLLSVAGVNVEAMCSSSDAVKSIASPSSLPTEDWSSYPAKMTQTECRIIWTPINYCWFLLQPVYFIMEITPWYAGSSKRIRW